MQTSCRTQNVSVTSLVRLKMQFFHAERRLHPKLVTNIIAKRDDAVSPCEPHTAPKTCHWPSRIWSKRQKRQGHLTAISSQLNTIVCSVYLHAKFKFREYPWIISTIYVCTPWTDRHACQNHAYRSLLVIFSPQSLVSDERNSMLRNFIFILSSSLNEGWIIVPNIKLSFWIVFSILRKGHRVFIDWESFLTRPRSL